MFTVRCSIFDVRVLLLFFFLFPACSKTSAEPRTVEISVKGMTCESCVNAITQAMVELPGVSRVTVSLEQETATVTHDPSAVSDGQLAARINQLGFEAVPPSTEPTSRP